MTEIRRIVCGLIGALLMAASAMAQNPLLLTQGTATGSITATNAACTSTACVSIATNALSGAVGVQITGTFVATATFEASVDGTNFATVAAVPIGTTRTLTGTATAAGVWQINAAGFVAVRARCTAYTSGTAVVTLRRAAGPSPPQ